MKKKEILKLWVSRNGDAHIHICLPCEAYDVLGQAMHALTPEKELDEVLKKAFTACGDNK